MPQILKPKRGLSSSIDSTLFQPFEFFLTTDLKQLWQADAQGRPQRLVDVVVSEIQPSNLINNLLWLDTTNNKLKRYIKLTNEWIIINPDTDLSNYYTKTDIDSALANKADIGYVDQKVAALVDSAPETLNTLNELSQALDSDPNFATTVSNQLGNKVDKVAGKQLSTEDYTTNEKNKLASVIEGATKVESSLINGNIKVNGVETVVYTLTEIDGGSF